MNIGKILDSTKTVSFDYKGETINLTVRENALTPSLAAKFKEAGDDPLKVAEGLGEAVTAWELDYNGADFPPTVENLARLPFDFLEKAIEALNESWAGKKTNARKSVAG